MLRWNVRRFIGAILQIPKSKLQINSNSQTSNQPRGSGRTLPVHSWRTCKFGAWSLKFLWMLEFGFWRFSRRLLCLPKHGPESFRLEQAHQNHDDCLNHQRQFDGNAARENGGGQRLDQDSANQGTGEEE